LPDREPAAEKTVNIDKKGLTSAAHWQIKRPVLALRRKAHAQTRADLGAIAQLGERLLCKQEVVGSIPSGSTKSSKIASKFNIRIPCYGCWFCALGACAVLFKRSAIDR
jgi:hypothetical protein